MSTLKVSLQGAYKKAGNTSYKNKINGENFKEVALVLSDLNNFGVPVDKAIKEFLLKSKSDWDVLTGN